MSFKKRLKTLSALFYSLQILLTFHSNQAEKAVETRNLENNTSDLGKTKKFFSFTEENETLKITYETSHNVVVEDLRLEPPLLTTFYATSPHIAADFNWLRKSGLKVNVGVSKINLWPIYLSHKYESDDNLFMLENPSISKEAFDYFNNTLQYFCQQPLPDHYKMFLELYKDRMTKAQEFFCPKKRRIFSFHKHPSHRISHSNHHHHHHSNGIFHQGTEILRENDPRCNGEFILSSSSSTATKPQKEISIKDGFNEEMYQKVIYRHLNEPCLSKDTFPQHLAQPGNSLVCNPGNDADLKRLFMLENDKDFEQGQESYVNGGECKEDWHWCQQCINRHLETTTAKNAIKGCGDVDCLATKACRCSSSPLCASGKVDRYTIEPVFTGEEINCHVSSRSFFKSPQTFPIAYEVSLSLIYDSKPSEDNASYKKLHDSEENIFFDNNVEQAEISNDAFESANNKTNRKEKHGEKNNYSSFELKNSIVEKKKKSKKENQNKKIMNSQEKMMLANTGDYNTYDFSRDGGKMHERIKLYYPRRQNKKVSAFTKNKTYVNKKKKREVKSQIKNNIIEKHQVEPEKNNYADLVEYSQNLNNETLSIDSKKIFQRRKQNTFKKYLYTKFNFQFLRKMLEKKTVKKIHDVGQHRTTKNTQKFARKFSNEQTQAARKLAYTQSKIFFKMCKSTSINLTCLLRKSILNGAKTFHKAKYIHQPTNNNNVEIFTKNQNLNKTEINIKSNKAKPLIENKPNCDEKQGGIKFEKSSNKRERKLKMKRETIPKSEKKLFKKWHGGEFRERLERSNGMYLAKKKEKVAVESAPEWTSKKSSVGFLSISHHNSLHLGEDLILTRYMHGFQELLDQRDTSRNKKNSENFYEKLMKDGKNEKFEYYISPFNKFYLDESRESASASRSVSDTPFGVKMMDNVWSCDFNFISPFKHTSKTWAKNNVCADKKISDFQELRKMSSIKETYEKNLSNGDVKKTEVTISKYNVENILDAHENKFEKKNKIKGGKSKQKATEPSPLMYSIKPHNRSPPRVSIKTAANQSILPYFFNSNGKILKKNRKLNINTALQFKNKVLFWKINTAGEVSTCPSYIGATLKRKNDTLLKYDLLIMCPTKFHLSLYLPINPLMLRANVSLAPQHNHNLSSSFQSLELILNDTHEALSFHLLMPLLSRSKRSTKNLKCHFDSTSHNFVLENLYFVFVWLSMLFIFIMLICLFKLLYQLFFHHYVQNWTSELHRRQNIQENCKENNSAPNEFAQTLQDRTVHRTEQLRQTNPDEGSHEGCEKMNVNAQKQAKDNITHLDKEIKKVHELCMNTNKLECKTNFSINDRFTKDIVSNTFRNTTLKNKHLKKAFKNISIIIYAYYFFIFFISVTATFTFTIMITIFITAASKDDNNEAAEDKKMLFKGTSDCCHFKVFNDIFQIKDDIESYYLSKKVHIEEIIDKEIMKIFKTHTSNIKKEMDVFNSPIKSKKFQKDLFPNAREVTTQLNILINESEGNDKTNKTQIKTFPDFFTFKIPKTVYLNVSKDTYKRFKWLIPPLKAANIVEQKADVSFLKSIDGLPDKRLKNLLMHLDPIKSWDSEAGLSNEAETVNMLLKYVLEYLKKLDMKYIMFYKGLLPALIAELKKISHPQVNGTFTMYSRAGAQNKGKYLSRFNFHNNINWKLNKENKRLSHIDSSKINTSLVKGHKNWSKYDSSIDNILMKYDGEDIKLLKKTNILKRNICKKHAIVKEIRSERFDSFVFFEACNEKLAKKNVEIDSKRERLFNPKTNELIKNKIYKNYAIDQLNYEKNERNTKKNAEIKRLKKLSKNENTAREEILIGHAYDTKSEKNLYEIYLKSNTNFTEKIKKIINNALLTEVTDTAFTVGPSSHPPPLLSSPRSNFFISLSQFQSIFSPTLLVLFFSFTFLLDILIITRRLTDHICRLAENLHLNVIMSKRSAIYNAERIFFFNGFYYATKMINESCKYYYPYYHHTSFQQNFSTNAYLVNKNCVSRGIKIYLPHHAFHPLRAVYQCELTKCEQFLIEKPKISEAGKNQEINILKKAGPITKNALMLETKEMKKLDDDDTNCSSPQETPKYCSKKHLCDVKNKRRKKYRMFFRFLGFVCISLHKCIFSLSFVSLLILCFLFFVVFVSIETLKNWVFSQDFPQIIEESSLRCLGMHLLALYTEENAELLINEEYNEEKCRKKLLEKIYANFSKKERHKKFIHSIQKNVTNKEMFQTVFQQFFDGSVPKEANILVASLIANSIVHIAKVACCVVACVLLFATVSDCILHLTQYYLVKWLLSNKNMKDGIIKILDSFPHKASSKKSFSQLYHAPLNHCTLNVCQHRFEEKSHDKSSQKNFDSKKVSFNNNQMIVDSTSRTQNFFSSPNTPTSHSQSQMVSHKLVIQPQVEQFSKISANREKLFLGDVKSAKSDNTSSLHEGATHNRPAAPSKTTNCKAFHETRV